MKRGSLTILIMAGAIAASFAQTEQLPAPSAPPPSAASTVPLNSARVETNPPPAVLNSRAGTNLGLASRSNITPVQLQNINRLDLALNGLGLPSRDRIEQRRGLIDILQGAPIAAIRPSNQSISRLGTILATVVPTLGMTTVQRRQLAIDLNMALNSGNLSLSQAERVITDARTLLQTGMAANPDGVEQLVGELTTLVAQVQGVLTQGSPVTTQENPQSPTNRVTQAGQGGVSQTGQASGTSATNPPAGVPSP